MPALTTNDLYKFIAAEKLGVLGTISSIGTPQSALVGIAVTRELEILFDTVKSSRKFANLTANPRCSFVVGWSTETTAQYEDVAREPDGPELSRYQQIYFA